MTGSRRRVTQQDIARLAGVSQPTVSLVLNGAGADMRISPETRERVLRAIRETGYVADPIARRLAAQHNRILGVFTYEAVFPTANSDFYHPFLVGIEQQAEAIGCDLLLLTSAPVVDGRRRIFHESNRLRLADGCVLLGRMLDRDDLARLVAEELPFVSVGRRDHPGVPYVGADYTSVVKALVQKACGMGHRRLAYLGQGSGPESYVDRFKGFPDDGLHLPEVRLEPLLENGITCVFAEEHADGVALAQLADQRGVELSIVTLGEPTRQAAPTRQVFTGFKIPRREMGAQAVEVLVDVMEGKRQGVQRLLGCELVDGETLVANG